MLYRFNIVLSQITLFTAIFYVIWTTLYILPHGTWMQHKQTWRRVNVTILNRRRTPTTSQDKLSLYLKVGLLLSHGRGLKSRTRTRKTSFVKYAANRSPHQTQTPPTYFTTYEWITTNSTERVYGWNPQKYSRRVLKTFLLYSIYLYCEPYFAALV